MGKRDFVKKETWPAGSTIEKMYYPTVITKPMQKFKMVIHTG
jgi:hypothetical protein